jgi:Ni,Fe-hydrogenase I small subunit
VGKVGPDKHKFKNAGGSLRYKNGHNCVGCSGGRYFPDTFRAFQRKVALTRAVKVFPRDFKEG